MLTINTTNIFDEWLDNLNSPIAKSRILARIRNAYAGNFGDYKSVGGGVYEMRVHISPGYRVYYAQQGRITYLLLCGGDKSTQEKDIKKARQLWGDIKQKALHSSNNEDL